jgi:hypothetical protein
MTTPKGKEERERIAIVDWLVSDADNFGAWLEFTYEDLGKTRRTDQIADYVLSKLAAAILNGTHLNQKDQG